MKLTKYLHIIAPRSKRFLTVSESLVCLCPIPKRRRSARINSRMSGNIQISTALLSLSFVVFASCEKDSAGKSDSMTVEHIGFVQLCTLQAGGESIDDRRSPTTEPLNATR